MRFSTTTTRKRQNDQFKFQRPVITWRTANHFQSGSKAIGVAIVLLIAIGCTLAFVQTMGKTRMSAQQANKP